MHVSFPPSPLPPHLNVLVKTKVRKYIVSFRLKQCLILMIEEKTCNDFNITGVLMLSFVGFYLYKLCMVWKLHNNI